VSCEVSVFIGLFDVGVLARTAIEIAENYAA
jgi:hypothetical protein